jgi:hypothetical protein
MADLMVYLGDDQGDFTEQDNRIIELDRDMQNMALGQVLEASVI